MSNSTSSDRQSQEFSQRIQQLEHKNSKEITQAEVNELATLKGWTKVNGFNISPVAMHLGIDWDTRVLHGIISSLCYNTGYFYGSIKWLMWQTGFKVMHIQRRLKIMKDTGLIRIEGKSPDWKIYDQAHNYSLIEKQKLSTDNSDPSVSTDASTPASISTDAPGIHTDAPSISTDASPPYTFSYIERDKERKKDVFFVFDVWKNKTGHHDVKITKHHIELIENALKDFSTDDLCDAINGLLKDAWHMEKGFTQIHHVFKDDSKVRNFIALAKKTSQNSNMGGSAASKYKTDDPEYIKRKEANQRAVEEAERRGREQFEKMAAQRAS